MIEKKQIVQACTNKSCNSEYGIQTMLFQCKKCKSSLEYKIKGEISQLSNGRTDLWKYWDLLPVQNKENVVSLGVGGSELIHLSELSEEVNGAEVYVKLDSNQNPTGTFKDREASIILSKCKELGLDNLVFYSTANTGRAYTHFAAEIGLTTYLFIPKQCQYKNTNFIKKNKNNFIILVDDNYPEISPYTKKFAKENGLTAIAPMHDRTESYATLAYELFEQMPDCDYFIQTIASGMGPIGFYKGHMNLINLGIQEKKNIPKIVCVQSSEMNVMSKAYNSGRTEISKDDVFKTFREDLFEPTLNSTNPVNNYPDLYKTLKENEGSITDVSPEYVKKDADKIISALQARGIKIRVDLENSLLIEFAGMLKLARNGMFKKGEKIVMLSCGRGKDDSNELLVPDAIIDPKKHDPKDLYNKLHNL